MYDFTCIYNNKTEHMKLRGRNYVLGDYGNGFY